MRRWTLFCALVATIAVAGLGGSIGSAAARRDCGTVTKTASYGSFRVAVRVERGKVTCRTARAVMRKAMVRDARVEGWRCYIPSARSGVDKICGQPTTAHEHFARAVSGRLL